MVRILTLVLVAGLVLAGPAAAQTAGYTATFHTTWTEETHPTDYPPSPHFSGLVGGTHDSTVVFWEPGQLASLGMKRMAEWGSQTDLLAEVQSAIQAGQAHETIADAPLWTVPGSTSVDFTVTPDFPLITLVAMIAPSPDWFIGVRNLDLRDGGGWAVEVVVDLFAFDAGTDSGPSYTSGDQPTVPPVPVFAITGYPFEPGVPIGTLIFTRKYVADIPLAERFTATAYPNPFNPRTTVAWTLPEAGNLTIDVFDVQGRHVDTLRSGRAEAGPGQVAWDGRDLRDRPAPSGIYFVKLKRVGAIETLKVLLLE